MPPNCFVIRFQQHWFDLSGVNLISFILFHVIWTWIPYFRNLIFSQVPQKPPFKYLTRFWICPLHHPAKKFPLGSTDTILGALGCLLKSRGASLNGRQIERKTWFLMKSNLLSLVLKPKKKIYVFIVYLYIFIFPFIYFFHIKMIFYGKSNFYWLLYKKLSI